MNRDFRQTSLIIPNTHLPYTIFTYHLLLWYLRTWSNKQLVQHILSIGFSIHHCSYCNGKKRFSNGNDNGKSKRFSKREVFVTEEDDDIYSALRKYKTL